MLAITVPQLRPPVMEAAPVPEEERARVVLPDLHGDIVIYDLLGGEFKVRVESLVDLEGRERVPGASIVKLSALRNESG